jgi:YD repeat-containing protein
MDGGLVNVATGDVLLAHRDVVRPGALPLVVGRVYLSSWRAGRWFGRTWASALDQRLRVAPERVTGVFGDGRMLSWRCTPAADGPRPVTGLPVTGPMWRLEGGGGDFTVTDPQAGLTWRFERRPGYRWSADQTGELPLVAVTDRAGHQIGYHYTRAGHPAWIAHSAGYRVRVVMDGNQVTALALAEGPPSQETTLVRYCFNPAGDLAAVVGPAGRALCFFGYDEEGRLTGWGDGAGASYRYRYDRRGRCVAGVDPDGLTSATFTYGDRVTWRTDAAGAVTTYQLDESSRVTGIRGPNGLGVEQARPPYSHPCYYDPVTAGYFGPDPADPGLAHNPHVFGPDQESGDGSASGGPAGDADRLRRANRWPAR